MFVFLCADLCFVEVCAANSYIQKTEKSKLKISNINLGHMLLQHYDFRPYSEEIKCKRILVIARNSIIILTLKLFWNVRELPPLNLIDIPIMIFLNVGKEVEESAS